MEKVIPIHNEPTADELWRGIGGHFDSLTQIINEMIDDSISAFVAEETAGEIIVSLTELPNNDVKITIEDSGCGMAKLDDVFRLGSQAASMSPLNEHGFGLKHALASVDVSNTSWAVYTRTKEDFSKGVYKKISAPYKTKDFTALVCDDAWPGKLTGTGTVVQFICPRVMYNTLGKGIREVMTNNFISLADILCEDIGFFYSRLLKTEKVKISLNITDIDGDKSLVLVAPLLPLWNSVKTGEANCDLGYGPVKIEYEYGRIGKKPARKQFDNATSYKYYKGNMSSSGLEIRLFGRAVVFNQFSDVWFNKQHPKFNDFIFIADLKSQNPGCLPPTRSSKNGFREGDVRLSKLHEWVRKMASLSITDKQGPIKEEELFKKLETNIRAGKPDVETSTNKFAYDALCKNKSERVKIDLFVKDEDQITVYEGKVNATKLLDVYQLVMYWDGLVYDGIIPTTGILVGGKHSSAVKELVKYFNNLKDSAGNTYNFECVTWEQLEIENQKCSVPLSYRYDC